MTMRLSIIIPAYNEEDRIVWTLTETTNYLAEQPYDSEILVVSDGSTDTTGNVGPRFQRVPRGCACAFLEYFPNRGKGYAVKYGMLRGEGDVIMFMDADYAVPMAALRSRPGPARRRV
jgi:dolichyl-phosphate beta-glucosyltransferase